MSYLLDTNVISEFVNAKPNPHLLSWLKEIPNYLQYISVITIGEIRKGVELMTVSKRQHQLKIWLEHEIPTWFYERIIPIDSLICDRWGCIQAKSKRPLPAIDTLLAATALTHNLTIVTRNDKDFVFPGLQVINPWKT